MSAAALSGALMLLEDSHAEQVTVYERGLDEKLATIRALPPIDSVAESARRNDINSEAKRAWKQLEETRKKATEPLLRDQRAINELFGNVQARLKECSAHLDKQLNAWDAQERARIAREREESERKQREAAEKEAQAVAAGDMKAAEEASREQTAAALTAPIHEAPRGIKSQSGTSFAREVVVFEIVNADLVPREYCSPDRVKLQAAVKAGKHDIPGIAVSEETRRTTRTR